MGLSRVAVVRFGAGEGTAVLRIAAERAVTREQSLDEAMDRYAQGEHAAFSVLHAGLEQKLRAFLTRLTGAPSLADDLLQETFMRIHRARGSFEPGAAVVPWAYAIARNAWLDNVRSAKVRHNPVRAVSSTDEASPSDPATGPEADAEQMAIARQTAALVEAVLRRLAPAQREAFVLLRYEGMSVEDAAAVLGATPTAVKLRAFRAYEALREALGQERTARKSEVRNVARGSGHGR
jgi:RNA polymerase sigma-70 factor, ECF subfamily